MVLRVDKSTQAHATHRRAQLLVIAAGCALLLLSLVFGGLAAKVVATIVVIAMLQGMWLGAGKIAGILIGMVIGVLIGPLLGKGAEGAVSQITGASGLINRMVSAAAMVLIVIVVVAAATSWCARRLLDKHPTVVQWDKFLGAGVGLGQGILVAMIVCWVPLALEPIARYQVRSRDLIIPGEFENKPNPVADGVLMFADHVQRSAFGRVAAETNPIEATPLLTLAADFVVISRHDAALQQFVHSPVIQEIKDLASVNQSIAIAESDPELMRLIREGDLTTQSINQILQSDTVLRMLDETRVAADIKARADQIAAAIREARAIVSETSLGVGQSQ